MGYVIAGILVVLIVAAAIAFFVSSATRRKGQASIAAPDSTPLGDTEEHAGEHSREGETVADPEAGRGIDPSESSPGVGGPGEGGVGGEGEGSRPVTPESERLANRER
ncbi:MAG TPA: hypothetical protein VFX51_06040 [Solirubrobacteraceae bacterium]|nr:hypothetical protein [Solirubrobacteraceae bacterium]